MKSTCFIAAVFNVWLHAQPPTPSSTAPKFDVVSIKQCHPGDRGGGDSSPGRLSLGCVILAFEDDNTGLIQHAYNRYATGYLNSFRIIPIEGAPDWVHSERFQIDAKAEGHPSIIMMMGPMMQSLLEDRFKLKIHRETRQGPVYELTLGKGDPKLKPLQPEGCTPPVFGRPLPTLGPDQRLCRNMANMRGGVDMEGGTLSMFAGLLGMVVDRPVIDKTGLTDQFEIHLKFSLDNPAEGGATVPDNPDIFQAIQEQLGLRLVPAKGPVDVLVIDHIERPSGN